MFNAKYFYYDGTSCASYGLQIADFNNDVVRETETFSPTLTLIKTPAQIRFFHAGVGYETAPSCEFSVISEKSISAEKRGVIMSWLVGRNEFKPLSFDGGGDNMGYTYNCVFTSVKTIWVNNQCHGFRLTAQFDSPYAKGEDTIVKITSAGTRTINIVNISDIDGYVYPLVEFTGGSIDIVNNTDDPTRHFTFDGLMISETITVDNETGTITSTHSGEKLSNFTSKHWLRLRKGSNSLTVKAAGKVTITCPHYAMIGY